MRRQWGGLLAASIVSLLASACASYAYTRGIGAGQRVDRANAYLYGRFMVNRAGGGNGLSVGLAIGCADGRQYTIGMDQRDEIQVIEIAPARCSLDEILFIHSGQKRGYAYPAPPMNRSVDYLPGTAYYLGDFALATSQDTTWMIVATRPSSPGTS